MQIPSGRIYIPGSKATKEMNHVHSVILAAVAVILAWLAELAPFYLGLMLFAAGFCCLFFAVIISLCAIARRHLK